MHISYIMDYTTNFPFFKRAYFLISEEIIFQRSIDCEKNAIFAFVGGEKSTVARKHFVLSPNLKFAKILNRGQKQSMLILFCICTIRIKLPYIHISKWTWEYCFFYVHSVKAFGDASVLWT